MNRLIRLACAFLVLTSTVAYSQHTEPDSLIAFPISSSVRVDGQLNEAAWSRAPRVRNFTQREPAEGAAAGERTEVAVLYDKAALYVGVWCYDQEPKSLAASKMSRDFDWSSEDNFEIILDTYADRRNGYLFVTNPLGAMADALVMNNGSLMNTDWDGVWEVATTVSDSGWCAEIMIPFSTLKFSSAEDQVWGVNFERNVRSKHEQVRWQGWSRDADISQVARAGTLSGISIEKHARQIELKPYVLAGEEWKNGSEELQSDVGGDVNYLITPTLKLNLTANPDFAQVESDRVQINLTRFSLYYPEKRKFFLEGRDVFDFGFGSKIQPFYSRRIGLAEDGSKVTVLGGVRLLGKQGNTTLGAMSLQTARRDSIATANYSVVRWKQDVLGESTIGLFGTGKGESDRFNGVFGGDGLYSSSRFLTDKTVQIGAAYAQSYSSGAATRSGSAHNLSVTYPNDLVGFTGLWERSGRGFNPEVGFVHRTDYQRLYTELQWKPRPPEGYWIRQFEFQPGEIDYYYNDQTRRLESFYWELRPLAFSTRSGEWIETNVQRSADHPPEDFEIRDGVVIGSGTYWWTHYEAQAGTYEGRPLWAYAFVNWGDYYTGQRTVWQYEAVCRLSKHLTLSGDYTRRDVSLPQGVFHTHEVGSRASFAVTPMLFGSLFGQWNNDDEEVQLNFRVNWIPAAGSDFYLVANQSYDAAGGWHPLSTTVLSKLVWRLVI